MAGRLVLAINIHFPFYLGAGVVALGIVILATAHKLLGEAERVQAASAASALQGGPAAAGAGWQIAYFVTGGAR